MPVEGRVSVAPPGTAVRVYLVPRERGGWQGRSGQWIEPLDAPRPAPDPAPTPSPARGGTSGRALDTLGLAADEMTVQGKTVLRVTAVERGKPAGRAGIEVGDIVIGYDGKPLQGPQAMAARVAEGGQITLMVVDINTGKVAQVPVDLGPGVPSASPSAPSPSTTPGPSPAPVPTPTGPQRTLGITAEPFTVNGRTALKMARVDPEGPGGKVGLEPGDILVAANGAVLTGPE